MLDKFVYTSNTCYNFSATIDDADKSSYLAPNLADVRPNTTANATDTNYYTSTTNNKTANPNPNETYTAVDCQPSNSADNTWYWVFTDLTKAWYSNVSASTTNISTITHPLYTNIGFDKCVIKATLVTPVENCRFYHFKTTYFCAACNQNA